MEETQYIEKYDNKIERVNREVISHSILALLEDKNKFISILKEQIQNQKTQLQFYLHRGLSSPQILRFADNCIPIIAEENLQLNLALHRFCKERGIKSRLMSLYERMVSIEKRLERTANQQEEIVQKHPRYSELLPKILESSHALRTELEAFRTCCKRLILLEDERNCLVEQVYSVPLPERMNYNALLVALYEKTRLEEEVGEIKKEQKRLILLLNTMKVPDQKGDSQKTVAKIDQRYFPKLVRLKEVNGLLAAKVSELQQDAQCKEILENKMEVVIDDYQEYREKSTKQLNELHAKLGAVLEENERLTQRMKQYQSFNEELNSLRASIAEFKSIRKERDYFKAQVEDLKSIRNTYSQMIEEPLVALRDQEMIVKNQEHHIMQLQKKNAMYKIEIANLQMRLQESYSQIKKLKETIKISKETWTDFSKKNCRDDYSSDINSPDEANRAETKEANGEGDTNNYSQMKTAVPMTSLNIQSMNSNGIMETLKAIVESTSPVDGIIQLSNSSAFTVHLTYGSQIGCNLPPNDAANNQEIIRQVNQCSKIVMDEFELMKDLPNEILSRPMNQCDVEEQLPEIEEEEEEDDIPLNRSFGCMFQERGVIDETCNTNSSVEDLDLDESPDESEGLRERFKGLVGINNAINVLDQLSRCHVKNFF